MAGGQLLKSNKAAELSSSQTVMDPVGLAQESGAFPEGKGSHPGSLRREADSQISPFADHSGYRAEGGLAVGKREAGQLGGIIIMQRKLVVVWTGWFKIC